MLVPVPLGGFAGGLNLRDAAELVTPDQAVDCLDVDFTARGAVRGRDGYARFGSYDLPGPADNVGVYEEDNGATRQLVVSCEDALRVIDSAGARIPAGDEVSASSPHWFARLGTIGGDELLASNGVDPMARWSGSAWTRSGYTGLSPDGRYVGVTPSGRVVMANFAGTSDDWATPSSVRWSDPGDPTKWQTWNWLVLTPGDGEECMGIATWRDLTFVFKRSKFFVFGREQKGSGGKPAFIAQPVDTGIGLDVPGGCVGGPQGVYFISRDGVFVTDGGPPVEASEAIQPVFTGKLPSFYSGQAIDQSALDEARLTMWRGRLHLSVRTGGAGPDRVFVFDPQIGSWSVHSIATPALAPMRIGAEPELVFTKGTKVMRFSRGYTDDDGVPIKSFWLGGFDNLGEERVKVVREVEVWGSGREVTVGLLTDYHGWLEGSDTFNFNPAASDLWGDGTDAADTWGAGGGPDLWGGERIASERRMRESCDGVTFALKLESGECPWTVYRATRHVRQPRPVESFQA